MNDLSRIIIIDPVTGLVEGAMPTARNTSRDSVRRQAGAMMQRKGLTVENIKSGNAVAG